MNKKDTISFFEIYTPYKSISCFPILFYCRRQHNVFIINKVNLLAVEKTITDISHKHYKMNDKTSFVL